MRTKLEILQSSIFKSIPGDRKARITCTARNSQHDGRSYGLWAFFNTTGLTASDEIWYSTTWEVYSLTSPQHIL